MRYMGLDVGDKTIGVAVSDELGISAQPLTTIRRGESYRADLAQVKQLVEEYKVEVIVIGLPLMMNGTIGVQAQKVEEFAEGLRRRVKAEIVMWDERLTTSEIERMLISDDRSRAKRKEVIDKLAASVILRSYMDSRRSHKMDVDENEYSEE